MSKMKVVETKIVRKLIANYIKSEGCSCCSNPPKHQEALKGLAKLLKVPMYKDKSGYNFAKFAGDGVPK